MKQPWGPALPDETVCPASPEGGKKATCATCQPCCGTAPGARNVVINDHGPTSQAHEHHLIQLGAVRR